MPLTYNKLYHISVTVPQDNGRAKWMVGPIYLTLVRASTQLPIVPTPLITVHQLCMLVDTEHIVSIVKCKFNSKKCCSVDCCFVLGWWVQCHVLCQQWCCACWSWWNTESYEACCCTGNTQLGSVNYTVKTYLMQSFPKFHFKQNNAAVSDGWVVLQKCGNYQKRKRIFVCQMFLKIYNGNKHI